MLSLNQINMSTSISVVNGAVNRIIVRKYQSEIWYTKRNNKK